MPRISDLCRDFAGRFRFDEAVVMGTARYLREANLLSKGARGPNAPQATTLDAARLLIALMVGGKAKNAAQTVLDFGPLKICPDPANEDDNRIPEGASFEETFSKLLEKFGCPPTGDIQSDPIMTTACRVSITPHLVLSSLIFMHKYREDEIYAFGPHEDIFSAMDRYPTGFRVEPAITSSELLSIGQVVAGRQPIGWDWHDDPAFSEKAKQAFAANVARQSAITEPGACAPGQNEGATHEDE